MEEDLDDIARGERESVPWLRSFYFGNGQVGLKTLVEEHAPTIDAREVNSIPVGSDADGNLVVARVGRYGPYLQRGDDTAPLPEDLPPDELTVELALDLLARGRPEGREVGLDPVSGLPIVARDGRYGPYVQLGEQEEGSKKRPPTASLFKSMTVDTVTLDDALRLLSLPREVGVDDAGVPITAQNGRFGPYIKRGGDSRSLTSEDEIFAVTLEQAKELLAQPKRGARSAAAPLAELGPDPESGAPIRLMSGRFGPYVTDGTVNASLRKGMDPAELTLGDAVAMLQAKRAQGPSTRPKRGRRKT
jgi:DNA topoisomerase-1